MAGLSVEKVQNGLSGLSLGDQMSSSNSRARGDKKNRARGDKKNWARGDKKNTGIEVVDKSKDTHHTYKVFYYKDTIFTTVTHSASVVDQWLADLYKDYDVSKLNNLVVGLDIEWRRPKTSGKICTRNKVAVLQLCLDTRCLIFQFLGRERDQVPESLKDFLGNDKFIFVGSGIEADPYKLMVDHGLMVARTEELGSLAAFNTGERRLHRAGLKKLVKEVLRQNLPKKRYLLSNWDKVLLKDEQIEYACLDAFVSFKLGVDLMSRSKNNNRQPEMVPFSFFSTQFTCSLTND